MTVFIPIKTYIIGHLKIMVNLMVKFYPKPLLQFVDII